MLAGITEYRRVIARAVRRARRGNGFPSPAIDIDVSIFDGLEFSAEGVPSHEHRRCALEARAELWKHIHSGDVINSEEGDESEPTEAVQTFEEWSHTE